MRPDWLAAVIAVGFAATSTAGSAVPPRPADWQLAACAAIDLPAEAVMISVTGRVRYTGDALGLLARVGRSSEQRGILYWSVANGAWQPMLTDASALSGPDPALRRPDFKPAEMQVGARLYMLLDDDRPPGPVVFATEIREADAGGFMTVAANVSPVTLMGMTIADPGDLASLLAVHRVGPDEFSYFALSSIALSPMVAASVSDASHINRAVAAFRYLAGIPGDREPPAAVADSSTRSSWGSAPRD